MTEHVRISVVVPTYRRRESLLRTLASLCEQSLPAADYEVIVSVDGSDDGSSEAAREIAVPYLCSVLEHPRRGRAAACNAGIWAAAGELIVLLDDDMEASPHLLEAHFRAHEGLGPRAVVGAAPILVPPDPTPFVRYMAEGFRGRLERLSTPGYRPGFRDAYTGNFSCRREVLQAVGAFDEGFVVYGHEDYELALRLLADGVELAYSADALAHQHYDKGFRDFVPDGIGRGRTAVLFAEKHPEEADQLKLAAYGRGDWKWRILRGLLLAADRLTDRVPGRVVGVIERLERSQPPRLHKYYALAIDYLFWHGASRALRDRRRGSPTLLWAFARVRLAFLLVLIYAGATAGRWVDETGQWPDRARQDEISANDRRFQDLRVALPDTGVVGYVGDPVVGDYTLGERNDTALRFFRRHLLAQYALAPVVVVEGTEPEFLVGNFEPDAVRPAPPGFRLVRDFGEGLVLYRRTAR